MKTKTAGNIELHRCLHTTSVFTSTQNVGTNASVVSHGFAYTCCTASFQPFYQIFAIRYNALINRVFRMDITECLLNTKVVAFLEFLWYHYVFCEKRYDSFEKVCY